MRNLSGRRDDTRLRWRWLLQKLDELDDDLAAEYLVQIDRGARFYDSVPAEDDLLEAARLAFRYLLATLLDRPMTPELAEFPAAVGALRASQGIALENLTAAVRTDFLVAWSALLRLAGDDDIADAACRRALEGCRRLRDQSAARLCGPAAGDGKDQHAGTAAKPVRRVLRRADTDQRSSCHPDPGPR